MPSGARFPKPRRIRLVVHPALEPPEPRAPRSALRAWTADLESALQSALDEANAGI
jgi:hypothetical protein